MGKNENDKIILFSNHWCHSELSMTSWQSLVNCTLQQTLKINTAFGKWLLKKGKVSDFPLTVTWKIPGAF